MNLEHSPSGDLLLLGAGGQLGRALAPRLSELGTVRAALRSEADFEDPVGLHAFVLRTRPRLVVNAAAYTAVDAAESDRERCFRVNTEAVGAVARAAAQLGVPMVHYSTNYVFDGAAEAPYGEACSTAPCNVYGESKLAGERLIRAATPHHLILRTAALYGGGASFVTRILDFARERRELRVVDDQFVSPTPAQWLADTTVAALAVWAALDAAPLYGTFHLTTLGSTSWHGFARRVLELRGEHASVPVTAVQSESFPSAARRPRNGVLDCSAFSRAYGIAVPAWDEALRHTIAPNPPSGLR